MEVLINQVHFPNGNVHRSNNVHFTHYFFCCNKGNEPIGILKLFKIFDIWSGHFSQIWDREHGVHLIMGPPDDRSKEYTHRDPLSYIDPMNLHPSKWTDC